MARRPWTSVEEHFASRHRPFGQNVDSGARNRIEREPPLESKGPALRNNRPQDIEDQHSPNYSNDVSSDDWRRGGGKGGATARPGFDKSGAWRKLDKGDTWGSPSDKVDFVKPEPVTTNKQQRRND
jgi:hypothetical protein